MLSRMCGIAELQWTEESSSLPGDKRTVGQRVSKEQCFSFLLQQEEQPSQQWMRAADCSLSHMSHSPRQACAGASAATVGDSALSVVQPSWAGHHSLAPEQAHTEAFQEKAAASPDTTTGHLCQRGTATPTMKEVSSSKWVSGTDSEPAQQHTATKTQAFGLSPPKSQFRERGKKVPSLLLGSQKSTALE